MKRYVRLLLILLATVALPAFAQEATPVPTVIVPPKCCGNQPTIDGSIVQSELSPDGLHLAILTTYPNTDLFSTSLEVLNTTETTIPLSLIPDLFRQDGFVWSPNSRYIAVTGNRANGSGQEFNVIIYDLLNVGIDALGDRYTYPLLGRFFGEAIGSNDPGIRPDYAPVWSADSTIIAINFRDGIHFYDITNCTMEDCRLLYILAIGYVPWFEWRGNIVLTLGSDNTVQLWDLSAVYNSQQRKRSEKFINF